MPYTAKQRARFHAGAARGEKGMKKLAQEADAYARQDKEKEPMAHKKAVAKKMPAKKAAMKKAATEKLAERMPAMKKALSAKKKGGKY